MCIIYMFISAFFRMLGDFSKNCFNFGRNAYKRKKIPKRYMSFTLKFQEKNKQTRKQYIIHYVFCDPPMLKA